jgi:hypothetical protein
MTVAGKCRRYGKRIAYCQRRFDPVMVRTMKRKADSFDELEVYQEACSLDFAIFELTKTCINHRLPALPHPAEPRGGK